MAEPGIAGEPVDAAALKRMRMRAWRRGTKEMDLILGPFADSELPRLDSRLQRMFEALLGENDHDLYAWVTARIGTGAGTGTAVDGTAQPLQPDIGPAHFAALLEHIAGHAAGRLARR